MQLAQNLDVQTENNDDPDLPSLKSKTTKPETASDKKQAKKPTVNLDEALTIVKSNKIASLTVRILIESLRVYLFDDNDQVTDVTLIYMYYIKIQLF